MIPPDRIVIRDGLAVHRIGDGPPILLMPGPHRWQQPGDGSAAALVDGVVRLGRQVISFDPSGVANSTRPGRVTMAEMHDCADEALVVAGIDRPVDCRTERALPVPRGARSLLVSRPRVHGFGTAPGG
jgi:hypothetical protein